MVCAGIPLPHLKLRNCLELDANLTDHDTRSDEHTGQSWWQLCRCVDMIGMQDHDVETTEEQMHHQSSVTLKGHAAVEMVIVLFQHGTSEVLNLSQDLSQGNLPSLDTSAINPDDTHHFIHLEAHKRPHHRRPPIRRLRRWSFFQELLIIAVEREFRLVVITTDARSWAVGFTGANVEEAELMPNQAADVCIQGIQTEAFAVAMETHTFSHADGGADENGVSTGKFIST